MNEPLLTTEHGKMLYDDLRDRIQPLANTINQLKTTSSNTVTYSALYDMLQSYYVKPTNGIPKSDLAQDAIPDMSTFVTSANPIFTGSISLGRASNSTIGSNSTAIGADNTASSSYSFAEGNSTKAQAWAAHAEGQDTTAQGPSSHAEGLGTIAQGNYSHAEGLDTIAQGDYSHAEGRDTTANNKSSHAEGICTIANGAYSHTGGMYNIEDTYENWPAYSSGFVEYHVGDKVKYIRDNKLNGYICKSNHTSNTNTAPSDATTNLYWTKDYKMNYAEIIGNGTRENNRSNARVLDWDGNEYLMGDIYVGCNIDSTGGTKLARIPAAPTTDGTYTLQCVVSNGEPTYSWIGG